jgi:DNA-binding transcriptional LysR family regulator
MLLDDLSAHGVVPKIALETTSKEVLKQFAVNGLGVAFIPDMVTKKETADGTLVKLKWAGAKFPIYSQVLVHKDKRISKAIEGFWQMVQEGEK